MLFIGRTIYTWLQRQCSQVESEEEYKKSVSEFFDFLNDRATVRDLSEKCREMAVELQEIMKTKESKLANYKRMEIRNCMDAMTTSPVESCNSALKHGSHAVHSNMNLETTCKKTLDGIHNKIQRRRNAAEREIARRNNSSRGTTKNDVIKKGQGLIDAESDRRHKYCCAQLDEKTWIVWCFENEDLGDLWNAWPMSAVTKFHRVRLVTLEDVAGKKFLKCSCCYQDRVGTPCRHVLCVTDGVVELSMIDVRWYKAFHVHFGSETALGMFSLHVKYYTFCFLFLSMFHFFYVIYLFPR